ncbi:UNVERIFIED_CONTAM: hypothetical protein FKN15_047732 [Acipenser sinensis]
MALYYRAAPDGTLAFKNQSVAGSKKCKERVTLLICCNLIGTNKRKVLLIGKSKNPRCFTGVAMPALPVTYVWMIAVLFNDWLLEFDRHMGAKQYKIALVLDNCAAHPRHVPLRNIHLISLPPNTTSLRIIKTFKALYRCHIVQQVINQINNGSQDNAASTVKTIHLAEAIHLLVRSWADVNQSTIVKCFKKAKFVKQTTEVLQAPTIPEEEVAPPDGMTVQDFETLV